MSFPRPLKNALLRLPHPMLLAAYYGVYFSGDFRRKRSAAQLLGLPSVWEVPLIKSPKSDTLFILASGSSINKIDDQGWAKIASHDSYGFNFWLVHPFVPSVYFCEAMDLKLPISIEVMKHFVAISSQRLDYEQVPKVISDLTTERVDYWSRLPTLMKNNTFSATGIPAFACNETQLKRCIRALRKVGLFSLEAPFGLVFKYCATLAMLVSLGCAAKYKRIVICGADITNPAYFYQDEERFPHAPRFQSSPPNGRIHATGIAMRAAVNVQTVLEVLNEVVLKPAGVKLFVENSCSALHPMLPVLRACDT